MSQGLNAYREWLGVAGTSEIPSYYELLGLRPLEPDTAQIEAAYQRQAGRLAARLSGEQADIAQRLMGELAEARLTLLTPTAKRAYDAALANAAGPVATTTPAATPASQAASPAPMTPQHGGPYPAMPQAMPVQQPAPGYPYGGYPAQAANPTYPAAQAYPGWQAQPAAAPGYYPQAVPTPAAPQAAAPQIAVEEPAIPTIRRRPVRRRSSPVPAVVGVLAMLAILGGTWLYFNREQPVVVVDANGSPAPNDRPSAPNPEKPNPERPSPEGTSDRKTGGRTEHAADVRPGTMPASETPDIQSPSADLAGARDQQPDMPADVANAPADSKADAKQPDMAKAATTAEKGMPDKAMPESSATGKAATETAMPDKRKAEPLEAKATAEETATVAALLKSARAALASRDVPKAQDLLAEATIEATAPDTTAEVGRVELLTSYVEMFWDAVRQTLPKIGLEELEINGTMMGVVEADENHLIIRAEGKNHEYKWQKLPRSIAYYLANRWLAPDDPLRNLVLASFEIVDPKGDRDQAETLLDAAKAAGLKSEPLMEELKLARGN